MISKISKLLYRSSIEFGTPYQTPPPKQLLPSIIRWPLRILLLPLILLDQAMQRLAKFIIKPPYKQVGGCSRRGNCCHRVLISKPKSRTLEMMIYFYYTQVYGFFTVKPNVVKDKNDDYFVMACRYLTKQGSCKHHRLRPTVCRQWPRIEYFDRPKLIKGCGYRPVLRQTGLVMLPEDSD